MGVHVPPTLTFGAFLARAAVPVAGVLASLVLLTLAALGVALDVGSDAQRRGLFAAGVLSWIFGIGWGVIVNATPVPPKPGA